jgi:hypothetical protein
MVSALPSRSVLLVSTYMIHHAMSPILSALLTLAHFPLQKIEEQRITIEDLEAFKELEENHIQVERELRDEILDREKDLREEKARVGLLEDIV